MRASLARLDPARRTARSAQIGAKLAELPAFSAARRVALYASLPEEVDTEPLIAGRWERGEAVWLPRMRTDGALDFVAVRTASELRTSAHHGIREPAAGLSPTPLHELDVMVLPGLAFDRRGVRLGRGGGFYDRTFDAASGTRRPYAIGAVFLFQLVDTVPEVEHDLRVDLVVTEHGLSDPR